jgi:hypothetical protein
MKLNKILIFLCLIIISLYLSFGIIPNAESKKAAKRLSTYGSTITSPMADHYLSGIGFLYEKDHISKLHNAWVKAVYPQTSIQKDEFKTSSDLKKIEQQAVEINNVNIQQLETQLQIPRIITNVPIQWERYNENEQILYLNTDINDSKSTYFNNVQLISAFNMCGYCSLSKLRFSVPPDKVMDIKSNIQSYYVSYKYSLKGNLRLDGGATIFNISEVKLLKPYVGIVASIDPCK